jgi:hypothetical protein
MKEKPHLTIAPWVKGHPIVYKCSLCEQIFVLPEDRAPMEGAAEVWAAFRDHLKEKHPEEVEP